jgi:hypothetical protein
MRRACQEFGWILGDDGTLLGLSLGYDGCAEHEEGVPQIKAALGVTMPEFPLGIADRMVTVVPKHLTFQEGKQKPRDKRRKAYPVAQLVLPEAWMASREAAQVSVALGTTLRDVCPRELSFYGEPGDKWHTEKDDIAAAWSREAFAVKVRGAENIQRLKDLYEAFQRKDIAMAVPWSKAFFRGGLSFVIASRMPQDAKGSVLAADQAHQELHLAAKATGIFEVLAAAKKHFYALGPSWMDDQKDEVIFFLNPQEQRRYNFGWFTVSELTDWAQERGPVIKDAKLEAFAEQPENYNWSYRLTEGLGKHGLHMRYHEKLVWFDEAKTIPGLRVRMHRDSESKLASGLYRFDEFMAKYASPLEQAASATA